MKIEVLLAIMFFENEPADFLDNMNIETDIVIGNQCKRNETELFTHNGHNVKVVSRNERGVGKNRNTILFNSDADIVLFADNDVCYFDGYAEKVSRFYESHPDADVVIFNFKEKRGDRAMRDIITKEKKAKLKDVTRFATWAISAKRDSILKKRITFSLLFGGGAKYSCGEDSLFLIDCYKRGLNIYLSDETIGQVIHKESTWYQGITEKLIFDKGVLFKTLYPRLHKLIIKFHVLKHKKLYSSFGTPKKVKRIMLEGAKSI